MKKTALLSLYFLFCSSWSLAQPLPNGEKPPNLVPHADKDSCLREVMPGIKIVSAEIGFMEESPNGAITIHPTPSVPVVKDTFFGWRMKVETTTPTFNWTEIYTHPQAPPQWIVYPPTVISDDKKTATTTRTQKAVNGTAVISSYWGFIGSEYPGTYTFEVRVNDMKVCDFSMDVVK